MFLPLLLPIILPILLIIGGVVLLVKMIKAPGDKKPAYDENTYQMMNELMETNRGIREELAVLKEKVNSIEKMIKEVS